MTHPQRSRRFTEILVYLGIVAFVVSVFFGFLNHRRDRLEENARLFEQRQLPLGLLLYQSEHGGKLPINLQELFKGMNCPADIQHWVEKRFKYVAGGLNSNELPRNAILLYEFPPSAKDWTSVIGNDFGSAAVGINPGFAEFHLAKDEILVWEGEFKVQKLGARAEPVPHIGG